MILKLLPKIFRWDIFLMDKLNIQKEQNGLQSDIINDRTMSYENTRLCCYCEKCSRYKFKALERFLTSSLKDTKRRATQSLILKGVGVFINIIVIFTKVNVAVVQVHVSAVGGHLSYFIYIHLDLDYPF